MSSHLDDIIAGAIKIEITQADLDDYENELKIIAEQQKEYEKTKKSEALAEICEGLVENFEGLNSSEEDEIMIAAILSSHDDPFKSVRDYISGLDNEMVRHYLATFLYDVEKSPGREFILSCMKEVLPIDSYIAVLEKKYLGEHDT